MDVLPRSVRARTSGLQPSRRGSAEAVQGQRRGNVSVIRLFTPQKRNRRVLKTADSDSECCLVHVQVAEEPKTAFAADSNLVFAQTPAASERRHRHHRCLFLLLLVARRRKSRHTLSPCSATAFQKKSPNKPNFRDC